MLCQSSLSLVCTDSNLKTECLLKPDSGCFVTVAKWQTQTVICVRQRQGVSWEWNQQLFVLHSGKKLVYILFMPWHFVEVRLNVIDQLIFWKSFLINIFISGECHVMHIYCVHPQQHLPLTLSRFILTLTVPSSHLFVKTKQKKHKKSPL